METEISAEKLKEFIKNESSKKLSSYDIARRVEIIKLEMLKEVKQGLKRAISEKNSTMVAAIAEILKQF